MSQTLSDPKTSKTPEPEQVRSDDLLGATNHSDPVDLVEELFEFLQGRLPDGYRIPDDHLPRLSEDQAWTVVWYLGNLYYAIPDHIERCDQCGRIFNTWSEGSFREAPGTQGCENEETDEFGHCCDDCTEIHRP